jgi:hypothetical protein
MITSVSVAVAVEPLIEIVGSVAPCRWQEVIANSGRLSVQLVKVSVLRLPLAVVGEEFDVTVAVKVAFEQVSDPRPVASTAGPDEVLVIVVEPVRSPPPGSRRKDVDAGADTDANARRPRAAIVAGAASFRMGIKSSCSVG